MTMASLSIFDDGSSTDSDQSPETTSFPLRTRCRKTLKKAQLPLDSDLDHFRYNLWRLSGGDDYADFAKECEKADRNVSDQNSEAQPSCFTAPSDFTKAQIIEPAILELIPEHKEIEAIAEVAQDEPPKHTLRRYIRTKRYNMAKRTIGQEEKLSGGDAVDGLRERNILPEDGDLARPSYLDDTLDFGSTQFDRLDVIHETCHSKKMKMAAQPRQEDLSHLTPPLSPVISPQALEDLTSDDLTLRDLSSLESDGEDVSEDHRRYLARKQYYARGGILWDIAAQMLQGHCLHPSNLTVYEFTKLVCFQGPEVFAWITSNNRYLVNRAERQWYEATSLLQNNADLKGLNVNFMDDFLWMKPHHRLPFIKAYKRLQLDAMALREGVKLSDLELNVYCTLQDAEKIAFVHLRTEEALNNFMKEALHLCTDLGGSAEVSKVNSPQADNLHLKFLHGLGQEKSDSFQDIVGTTKDMFQSRRSKFGLGSQAQHFSGIAYDRENSSDQTDLSPSIFDSQKESDEIYSSGSEAVLLKTKVDFAEPMLVRRSSSHSNLGEMATADYLMGLGDDTSDCDFSPSRSLRKRASRLFGALKKPFVTFSGRRATRPSIKGHF